MIWRTTGHGYLPTDYARLLSCVRLADNIPPLAVLCSAAVCSNVLV